MLIVDIGAGRRKLPGSISIDFSPFADVDYAIDLNTDPLPFDDNSVDYIHSSHCLEHLTLKGFMHVMHEIYRVLKPNGQCYIGAPYFSNPINWANPFHDNRICFNEHTFRFFSSVPTTKAMPLEDYSTTYCQAWGLRYSANSEIEIEFELLHINYAYSPRYASLTSEERRKARRALSDVVENISFVLRAVKPCPKILLQPDLDQVVQEIVFIETKRVELGGLLHDARHLVYNLPLAVRSNYEIALRKIEEEFNDLPIKYLSGPLYSWRNILIPPFEVIHINLPNVETTMKQLIVTLRENLHVSSYLPAQLSKTIKYTLSKGSLLHSIAASCWHKVRGLLFFLRQ
ncbi:class I SAM-dependent methyltransferase [Desulfocurvibacter africanus]|uniref:Methyltransferase type 11 n=1 Tax=Desulfocurvibacter africanus subsp. africanus str. Walvis Bay TaxID=690850 RepID=F3YWI1_DESAF|nr:class I SAM-dependent methyltransferase [Desulfocurvibacter africanus]EGJ49367.1 Methyltransferase type 11 [Desulfocurvibacter africanus subsp. africanus str. Walvis Bay]